MTSTRRSTASDAADLDGEPIIDLRHGEARIIAPRPASPYGYDGVLPESWSHTPPRRAARSLEKPGPATCGSLPQRFRLVQAFPSLQRVVHHGPIDGRDVEVKLTIRQSIMLHTTGVEHSMAALDGRVRDRDHLRLLIDSFGRDQRLLGSRQVHTPRTLAGAKKQWHRDIASGGRHGFAITERHLVLLHYLPPERDPRRRGFGIAYKRIVRAYQIAHD